MYLKGKRRRGLLAAVFCIVIRLYNICPPICECY